VNTVIYYISPNPPPTTTPQKIYLYKYSFIRTTHVEFQTVTITPQGNLTSDREISSIYNNGKIRETVQEVRFPMSYHN
jgi:hypothetical protein